MTPSTSGTRPQNRIGFWLAGLAVGAVLLFLGALNLGKPVTAEQARQIQVDQTAVRVCRDGLRQVVEYVEKTPALFPEIKLAQPRLLKREEKEQVWATWKRYLDYLLALDALSQRHAAYWKL